MKLKTLFNSLSLSLFLLLLTFITTINLHAQDNQPKPLDISFLNLIQGTWAGESEMMGTKMNEELVITMNFNNQFLIINLTAGSEDKTHTYTGMGVYGSDAEGNVSSYWFDDWGLSNISTGTGKIDGMKMTLDAKSPTSVSKRSMELTGGNLVMKWTSTWKDKDGQEQTMSNETTYAKRK